MEHIETEKSDVMKDETNPDAVYTAVIDADGSFVFINSNFHKDLHSNALNILHKTFFDFIHPEDVESCKHALAYCLLMEGTSAARLRLKEKKGKWVKWQITNIGKAADSQQRFLMAGSEIGGGKIKEDMQLESHHYATLFEKLGVGVLFQDKNGTVISANNKMAEIFNTSLEQVYRHNAFEQLWKATYINGDPVPFEDSPPMIALRSGQTQNNILVGIETHGSHRRQVIINTQPVFDDGQTAPSYVISSMADLSEEKKLKALCEQREALFTSFMDHSPSFAWIVDEEEKVLYANQGLLDYFGADKTVLNRNIYEVLPRTVADAGHEKHKWVLENNLPHNSILRSTQVNGQEQLFNVTTFPVKGEKAEKLVCGQAWNITESYQAKLELKKTNERLLYLSRASSESIWDWNMKTGQIFRNQALLKLIGYQEEKPSGLSWWYKQIHPGDRKKVEKKIECILAEKKKAWEQEYRFLCSDGSYKIVLDRGFVVYQDNIPIRMVGSLQDISEIKQLEVQLTREKLKKQKQIAEAILQAQEQERTRIGLELHDNVNQILFTAKLYLDVIKPVKEAEKDLKNKTQEFILLAIEEIRKLSKDLVSPSLKEMGLIPCINRLINELDVVDPFKMDLILKDEKKIESVNYHIKITLFRIIQEQIKNIIKYSQARKVILSLSVIQQKVHLLIEDDGVGFDEKQTIRGIGLSNIYERTKLYNGKVDLKTQPGQGCRIKIIIPFY